MARPKKDIKRIKHIDTRLTLKEYEEIIVKAKSLNITPSEFFRNLALNYPIKK